MNTVYKLMFPALSDNKLSFYHAEEGRVYLPRVFPAHTDLGTEMYVLEEGESSFRVEDRIYDLTAGDVIFSRPGEIHNCVLKHETMHRHYCFWLDPKLESLLNGLSRFCGKERRISLAPEQKARLLSLCAALTEAAQKEDSLLSLCRLLELLHLCGGEPNRRKQYPPRLQEILSEMTEHFATIQDLSYLSDKYFISQSTLNRLFRQWLGTSPGRYLEGLRLSCARMLLTEGKSVFEAGNTAGFSDYSGFIRLFKKRYGMTPAAYRRLGYGANDVQPYINKES